MAVYKMTPKNSHHGHKKSSNSIAQSCSRVQRWRFKQADGMEFGWWWWWKVPSSGQWWIPMIGCEISLQLLHSHCKIIGQFSYLNDWCPISFPLTPEGAPFTFFRITWWGQTRFWTSSHQTPSGRNCSLWFHFQLLKKTFHQNFLQPLFFQNA